MIPLKECVLLKGEVLEESIMALVIASSEEEARMALERVLKKHIVNSKGLTFLHCGQVPLEDPVTKLVFCSIRGKIIDPSVKGFCPIAMDGHGGCVYYPCCNPLDRGSHCKDLQCTYCNHRRCKPNPDGTISIDNVPCGH